MWNDTKNLEKTLDSANFGLWEWDVKADKISLSETAKRIHGIKIGEFNGEIQEFLNIIHKDDRNKFDSGTKGPLIYRIITPKGLIKWIEATRAVLKDGKKQPIKINGTCIDITSKIESQERLNAQLTIFNELAKSTSLKEISEKILMTIATTFGWDIGVMWLKDDDGTTVLKTTWPKNNKRSKKVQKNGNKIVSKFLMPIESNSKVEGALEFYSSNGKPRYDTSLSMLNAIKNNIGQVVEKQKMLREKEIVRKQMQTIFNNVPFGITVENAEGDIINANKPLAVVFEKPADYEFIGHNIKELFSEYKILDSNGVELKFDERPAQKSIDQLQDITETLSFMNKKTGEKKYISVKASLIDNSNINERIVIKSFKDLTETLEDQRQRDFFVGILGHELKNPLASIKAYAQLLKRNTSNKKSKIFLYSDSIESQADRLAKLISNIFDLTKFTSGKFELNKRRIDLDTTLIKIIANYKLTVPKREIVYKGQANTKILVDEDRLVQVLINLLSNANKYSAKNKTIEVIVKKNDTHVEITVKDHGIGIPKKYHSEIFKLFRVIPAGSRNKRHGLGMGLTIANGIVKAHGGNLIAKSKLNQGTEFIIKLPL